MADEADTAILTTQLAPMAKGRIALQYRRVTCTPQQPVSIRQPRLGRLAQALGHGMLSSLPLT